MTKQKEKTETIVESLENDKQRRLVDLIRRHGAGNYVQLPQIAVMGDTSSGKSSVLSAISGIQFPSSDRLTTRCPTQLIMQTADEFSATVRLQRFKKEEGKSEPERSMDTLEQVSEIIAELTEMLVEEGAYISNDSIVIEMAGPQLPNLTLIDLPGLVRTVGDGEDPSIIESVRSMVRRYLEQERTVILAVVPANVDMHNTEILQAAQEADPSGNRTISVITKPDLIDKGAERAVEELLRNQKKKLKMGYHMVKCRGQQQLNDNVSIQDGIRGEASFFEAHSIWSKIPNNLVGIPSLRQKLGALLERRVKESLPSVAAEINEQLKKCDEELANYGPDLASAGVRRAHFNAMSQNIRTILKDAIEGSYRHVFFDGTDGAKKGLRFRAQICQLEEEFSRAIAATRIPCVGELQVGDEIDYQTSEGWISVRVYSVKDQFNFQVSIAIREGVSQEDDWVRYNKGSVDFGWLLSITPSNLHKIRVPISRVVKMLKENRSDQLPIFPNYTVFRTLVAEHFQKWEEPALLLADTVLSHLRTNWTKVTGFAASRLPRFKQFLNMHGDQVLCDLESKIKQRILHDLQQERIRPYTLNHYLFDLLHKLRTEPLLQSIESLSTSNGCIDKSAVLGILGSYGVGKESNTEQEAREIHIALAAYVQVAAKRFTDHVPMVIQIQLVEKFQKVLLQKLESLEDEELKQLMVEDADSQSRRLELAAKKTALTKAVREMVAFF